MVRELRASSRTTNGRTDAHSDYSAYLRVLQYVLYDITFARLNSISFFFFFSHKSILIHELAWKKRNNSNQVDQEPSWPAGPE